MCYFGTKRKSCGGGGSHQSRLRLIQGRKHLLLIDKWSKVPPFGEGNEWVYVVINDMIIVLAIRHFVPTAIKSPLHTDKPLAYPSSSGTSVIKIRLNWIYGSRDQWGWLWWERLFGLLLKFCLFWRFLWFPLYLISVWVDVSVSALLYELITSFYPNRLQYPTEMKVHIKNKKKITIFYFSDSKIPDSNYIFCTRNINSWADDFLNLKVEGDHFTPPRPVLRNLRKQRDFVFCTLFQGEATTLSN